MKPKRMKKEKGYWIKKTEHFSTRVNAEARVASLRLHRGGVHVRIDKGGEDFLVTFSVAKWYLEEAQKAGIKL